MTWGKRICFCLGAICLFLGGNEVGRAADWVLTPSIETRAEYLNNIFYSARFKKSDYILSAVPKLEFSYNTEKTNIGGSLSLVGQHYLQNPNLDTIDQFYNLNAGILATARLKLNLMASYISTIDSQASVLETNLFTIRQRTNLISVSPGFTFFLTERWSTDFSYRFSNVNYQLNPFSNYSTHTINSRLNYAYTEKTTFVVSVTASYSQYEKTDNNIVALGPQIGFIRKFTENWDMTFLGGANFSQVESNVTTTSANNIYGFVTTPELQKQKTSSIDPFINISTNCRWKKGGVSFSYTRSQSANAIANQSQYHLFGLNLYQDISERLKFGINPYFNITTYEGQRTNYSQYYYGISPQLTYKLTEKASIGARYAFSYRTDTGNLNNTFPINDVYVFFNYSYPIHYQR